jgi:hypothetical protein
LEPFHDDPAQLEPAQLDPAQLDPTHAAPFHEEPFHEEPFHDEPAQLEPVHGGPVQSPLLHIAGFQLDCSQVVRSDTDPPGAIAERLGGCASLIAAVVAAV